ncbi:hypothetical protein OSTOST_21281 [Ostertagia ostertagi]
MRHGRSILGNSTAPTLEPADGKSAHTKTTSSLRGKMIPNSSWIVLLSGILYFFRESSSRRTRGHEKADKSNLQKAVIDAYCYFGSKDCIEKFKDLFDREVIQKCESGQKASNCVSVAAPLRAMVYCYGVKEGGDDAFNKVKELYYAETVQLEKDYLLRGLGCHKDITALKG